MNSQFIGRARHSSSEEMAARALESFNLGLESETLSESFNACVLVIAAGLIIWEKMFKH